jgi:hypothetical protein
MLLLAWSRTVRAEGYLVATKPTADNIMVVELCISDVHKPLLLANPALIPYLVDALLLVSSLKLPLYGGIGATFTLRCGVAHPYGFVI